MNCHAGIHTESPKLLPVRESTATGMPVPWVRVHDLPDYAYFDHSAHVDAGVGCVSCHGRVDKMEVVYQAETLSMGWCLDCHRDPEPHLRPLDEVTNMDWVPEDEDGRRARSRAERTVRHRSLRRLHRHATARRQATRPGGRRPTGEAWTNWPTPPEFRALPRGASFRSWTEAVA